MKKLFFFALSTLCATFSAQAQIQTSAGVQYLMNTPKDMSTDFSDLSNTYFLADSIASFDTGKAVGTVKWDRYRLSPRQAFNLNGYWPVRMQMLDFPSTEYDNDPVLKIQLRFISPRCVRLTMLTTPVEPRNDDATDPMFAPEFLAKTVSGAPADAGWQPKGADGTIAYKSDFGSIEIHRYPFRIALRDKNGRILTQSRHIIDND